MTTITANYCLIGTPEFACGVEVEIAADSPESKSSLVTIREVITVVYITTIPSIKLISFILQKNCLRSFNTSILHELTYFHIQNENLRPLAHSL